MQLLALMSVLMPALCSGLGFGGFGGTDRKPSPLDPGGPLFASTQDAKSRLSPEGSICTHDIECESSYCCKVWDGQRQFPKDTMIHRCASAASAASPYRHPKRLCLLDTGELAYQPNVFVEGLSHGERCEWNKDCTDGNCCCSCSFAACSCAGGTKWKCGMKGGSSYLAQDYCLDAAGNYEYKYEPKSGEHKEVCAWNEDCADNNCCCSCTGPLCSCHGPFSSKLWVCGEKGGSSSALAQDYCLDKSGNYEYQAPLKKSKHKEVCAWNEDCADNNCCCACTGWWCSCAGSDHLWKCGMEGGSSSALAQDYCLDRSGNYEY